MDLCKAKEQTCSTETTQHGVLPWKGSWLSCQTCNQFKRSCWGGDGGGGGIKQLQLESLCNYFLNTLVVF